MMPHTWLAIRILVMAFWLYAGFSNRMSFSSVPILFLLAAFLWGAIVIRFWVIRTYTAPHRQNPWLRPSWTANPFMLDQPFQFFHLAGFSFLAFTVAAMMRTNLAAATDDPFRLPGALLAGAFGLGILCGIYWAARVYDSRFQRADPSEA